MYRRQFLGAVSTIALPHLSGAACAAGLVLRPRIVSDWVHVYVPAGDVFPGPDSPRFKTGQFYPDWQVNDHAILKGPDGRWHAFGITHPAVAAGEPNPHEAEWMSFHAVAPPGKLKQHLRKGAWKDQPKVLPPSSRPGELREHHSPFIIRKAGVYHMIYGYSPIRYATSTDLWSWTPKGSLFRQEGSARDPSILAYKGEYLMCYTTKLSVMVRKSPDLIQWSEPTTIFSLPNGETGGPESPTILALESGFYLIWCRWDATNKRVYQDRSFVYFSTDPMNFHGREAVGEIQGHAPEFFQDEDGDWWISSAERPARGLSIARIRWERQ